MAEPITANQDVVLRADGLDLVRAGRMLLDGVTYTERAGDHWPRTRIRPGVSSTSWGCGSGA